MWVLTRSDESRFVSSWNRMLRAGVARTMRLVLVRRSLRPSCGALWRPRPLLGRSHGSLPVPVRAVRRPVSARSGSLSTAPAAWCGSTLEAIVRRSHPDRAWDLSDRRRRKLGVGRQRHDEHAVPHRSSTPTHCSARIPVANWPAHVTAAFGSVWVSAYQRGTVSGRVDPRRNRVSRVYAVGGKPSGVAQAGGAPLDRIGRNGSSLGRLDPRSGTLTKSSIGHNGPGFLSAIAGSLWTTTANGFQHFDPSAKQVVAAFPVPGTPAEAWPAPTEWSGWRRSNTTP